MVPWLWLACVAVEPDDECLDVYWAPSVYVFGPDLEVPKDLDVSFVHDDGPVEPAVCAHLWENGQCSLWHGGFEEPGTFEFTVVADGYEKAVASADVELGFEDCHVEPAWIDIELERIAR